MYTTRRSIDPYSGYVHELINEEEVTIRAIHSRSPITPPVLSAEVYRLNQHEALSKGLPE